MGRIRVLLARMIDAIVLMIVPVLAPLFSWVARTGVGSDICLKWGFLPLPVHYHSPVPDIQDLEQRKWWEQHSKMIGVDFRLDQQVQLLRKLGDHYGPECRWSPNPSSDPLEFYTENNRFSFGCAAITYSLLRHFKSQMVVEVGSGASSLVISEALSKNLKETRESPNYQIIDPYPSQEIETGLPGLTDLLKQRVELMDLAFFETLSKGDVLFIDSGHTVKTGGDVNYLFLEVLPRLNPGVVVHVHDIPLPKEYPKIYFTNPRFRMFWTEAYILQAFLCFNSEFEIILAMSYIMDQHHEEFQSAFQNYDPLIHRLSSSSFWMRRRS